MTEATDDGREGLRRGWTTGACATAATKAALTALLGGAFPDPVEITLPRGQRPAFALAMEERGVDFARAGIVKDAGDDPDVTHLALIVATVRWGVPGSGVTFVAGPGVGTVSRPGLPIPPGEPAVNPVPRRMMTDVVTALTAAEGRAADVVIELSVPGGEALARHTWNPRLGIVGGLSILGTTGIVVPYSCSAWIHAIHRGVDVARAAGHRHVVGSTGSTSEDAARRRFDLPDTALLDMGDFAGALLKYLRRHPVDRCTIAGGFAKLSKLAVGHLDLHSGRSTIDRSYLADSLATLGAAPRAVSSARTANTALEVQQLASELGLGLADVVAADARATAVGVIGDAPVAIDVLVVDREGNVIGTAEPGGKQ